MKSSIETGRTYIRGLVFGMAVISMILTVSCQKSREGKPNIIIIFTDDQGYGDLGCYGSPNISTPNIDQMAEEGLRFSSFYAAPFCGPSRAQLMTGCYPPRVGHARNPGPGSNFGLHPNEVTIAELLKDEAYATMCIGKWHLGDAPEFLPTRQGFDAFFGIPFSNDMWSYHPKMPPLENEDSLMLAIRERAAYTGYAGQGSYYPSDGGFPNALPLMYNEAVIEENPDQQQLTTRYTEAALTFIDEQHKKPFFLYLAHAMPHVPLFVSKKFADKSIRGLYGDVIMEIDWSVGQIIDRLKQHGIDEKTLVVFTSDNGPWLAYGIDGGSAGPLRDGKGSSFEGGERVPAIFRWPGKIPPNRLTDAFAGNLDLLPTIGKLAGSKLPQDRVLDGRDLWPLLSGETDKSPHQYFHYFGGSGEGRINYRGIRDERWKLLLSVDSDSIIISQALYDLNADVSERFDRLQEHPEIAKHLNGSAQKFYDELTQNLRPAGHRIQP